jgi:hypothetical protein
MAVYKFLIPMLFLGVTNMLVAAHKHIEGPPANLTGTWVDLTEPSTFLPTSITAMMTLTAFPPVTDQTVDSVGIVNHIGDPPANLTGTWINRPVSPTTGPKSFITLVFPNVTIRALETHGPPANLTGTWINLPVSPTTGPKSFITLVFPNVTTRALKTHAPLANLTGTSIDLAVASTTASINSTKLTKFPSNTRLPPNTARAEDPIGGPPANLTGTWIDLPVSSTLVVTSFITRTAFVSAFETTVAPLGEITESAIATFQLSICEEPDQMENLAVNANDPGKQLIDVRWN